MGKPGAFLAGQAQRSDGKSFRICGEQALRSRGKAQSSQKAFARELPKVAGEARLGFGVHRPGGTEGG